MAAGRRETSRVVVLNADMLAVSVWEDWVLSCWREAKGESNHSNVMFKLRSRLGLSVGCITYHAWAFAWWRGDWYAE